VGIAFVSKQDTWQEKGGFLQQLNQSRGGRKEYGLKITIQKGGKAFRNRRGKNKKLVLKKRGKGSGTGLKNFSNRDEILSVEMNLAWKRGTKIRRRGEGEEAVAVERQLILPRK